MECKRVLVIGCSGSGKSTLALELSKKTKLPVVHLDNLFWDTNWKKVSSDTFQQLLQEELSKDCWIMEGNYNSTLATRIQYCDTIIYLDLSGIKCIFRVMKRKIKSRGKKRSDMADNQAKFLDFNFLKWIWNYNSVNRETYYNMLRQSQKEYFILHNNRDIRKFLKFFTNENSEKKGSAC